MKTKFIVLEGVDGTGKTTVAKRLTETMKARYVITPMHPIDGLSISGADDTDVKFSRYISDLGDVRVRFCYYLLCSVHASHEISKLLARSSVVCDRYISSTLAYHRALDSSLRGFSIAPFRILRPTHEFLLTVSDTSEWSRRLSGRPSQRRADDWLERDPNLLRRVEDEYRRLGLTEIDTSGLDATEIAKIVRERVQQ